MATVVKPRLIHALLAGLSVVLAVVVGLLINLVTDKPQLILVVSLMAGVAVWVGLEFVRSWGESRPGSPGDQRTATNAVDDGPPGRAGSESDGSPAAARTAARVAPDEPAQRPAPAGARWQMRANVDHHSDGYFGRERITESLARTLANRASQIVTLQGVGGVGKTTTAYEAVSQVERDGHFGAILWTKVRDDPWQREGPVGRSWAYAARDLASQLSAELGPSTATWDSDVRDALKDTQHNDGVLTVLDNLEIDTDMRRFTERLHRLGFATPPHKLLVTSRAVAPLVSIRPYELNGLDRDAAVDLIRHLGADDERLAAAPAVQFDPILDAVDGNPLLIKIVVRRFICGSRSLAESVAELPSGRVSDNRTVADHLFGLALGELARRAGRDAVDGLMYAFSVEGRRGGEYHADQLKEMSGLPEEQFRQVLDSGRDLGLIGGGNTNERYSIHSLLHDVVRQRLRSVPGER
ncbi:MAG: NB-ARC domain-containing protein [Micromonosporaceae bacterium]